MYSCQLASVYLYNFLHMNASHIQLARSCLEFIFVISLGTLFCRTLRTLASQPKGCLRLRDHPQVIPALQVTKAQICRYDHTLNYSTRHKYAEIITSFTTKQRHKVSDLNRNRNKDFHGLFQKAVHYIIQVSNASSTTLRQPSPPVLSHFSRQVLTVSHPAPIKFLVTHVK